jgi:hypothetical protein
MPVSASIGFVPPAPRTRLVRARVVEKAPPQHGEKPYAQLVAEAFDGPVLRLSQKMKLLEEADNRKIRRGDALDLIAAAQRELEAAHPVEPRRSKWHKFFTRYAIFVACYVMFAVIWCVILTR